MLHNFDSLPGRLVSLHRVDESCITSEYINWLNDSEVVRYSNQRFHQHTRETCLQYLSSFRNTDNLFLVIRMIGSGEIVGTISAYISVQHGTADMGIMIGARSWWGKGIGLDAWHTLMRYLFSSCKLRKITGGTLRCNVGMVRVMERSGMHLEAVRALQQVVEGEAQDVLFYAKFTDL